MHSSLLLACLCALVLLVIFLIEAIGAINYKLNEMGSLYKSVIVKGFLFYLIPKMGYSNDIVHVNESRYRIYCCTIIFTIIQYALIAITLTLLLILYFLSVDCWWAVIFIPVVYLIAVIIAGTVIVKKTKTDSNPFH